MTESEHHSYSDTVDAIIKECDKNYRIIATHGEPLMAFKLASVIHEKGKKVIFVDADVSEEILSLFVAIRFQGSSTKPCPNENRLIREGRFADCVDELIQKVITAPVKRV